MNFFLFSNLYNLKQDVTQINVPYWIVGNGSEKHDVTLAQSYTLSRSDTLARYDTLARSDTLARCDTFAQTITLSLCDPLARRHFSTV